ncbi:MAG: ArnT family glycosyltransferase, partial [Anaerolineae bacterium]
MGKPSLLLGGLGLGILAQGQLTPRPTLEVGALLTVSTLFLLSLTLERQKAGLSSRQLLIKALFFFFPLAIGLWCRTLPSLVPSLPLYGLATLLFLLALGGKEENIQEEEPYSRSEFVLLALIVALGFLLLAYDLENIPPGFHGDEGESGMQALMILQGQIPGLISVGWYHQPILAFAWHAVTMKIFGDTVFGLRMSSVIVGTLTLIPLYFLTRLLFGKRVALLATLLLSISHWHIALNRIGINYTQTTLLEVTGFYFLLKGLRSKNILYFMASGLAVGMGLYLYFASRLVPFIIAAFILLGILLERGFWAHYRYGFVALFLAAALIFAPMAFYFLEHPHQFISRTQFVFLFSNLNHLERSLGTAQPLPAFLVQAQRMLLLFNHGPDRSGQYGYQGAMLDFLSAIFFVLGLAYITLHWRKPKHLFLLLWFWLTLIAGGMLTVPAPFTPRLAGMIPLPFILAGLALEKARGVLARAWEQGRLARLTLTTLMILVLSVAGFLNYRTYFVEYINSVQGWAQREAATMVAKYIRSLGDEYEIYLLGAPKLYLRHGTIRFIARRCEGVDVLNPEGYIPLRERVERNVAYIILPHRLDQLPRLLRYYPRATLRSFTRPTGEIRFMA